MRSLKNPQDSSTGNANTTPLTTDAIREMRAAITPGKYGYDLNGFVGLVLPDDEEWGPTVAKVFSHADGEFFAAAPRIVDFLLAEVERLRKELNGIVE